VSHRFSTVRKADLIVVLDGSRVVEVGKRETLVAKGGEYAELYEIQAAGAYRQVTRRQTCARPQAAFGHPLPDGVATANSSFTDTLSGCPNQPGEAGVPAPGDKQC
jgi:hypothetical protein